MHCGAATSTRSSSGAAFSRMGHHTQRSAHVRQRAAAGAAPPLQPPPPPRCRRRAAHSTWSHLQVEGVAARAPHHGAVVARELGVWRAAVKGVAADAAQVVACVVACVCRAVSNRERSAAA
jgi:hypothetical protein